MFIGHYGAALATKRLAPSLALGWLLVAAQLADLLFPVLSLLGVESGRLVAARGTLNPYEMHYPWSHSLATGLLASALLAFLFWGLHRGAPRLAVVVGLVAFSHLCLDLVTHRHLPLAPFPSPTLGLALGDRVPAAAALELLLLFGGCVLYLRSVRKSPVGYLVLGAFVLVLAALYSSALVTPSPESSPQLTASVLTMNLLLIGWGNAADRFWNRPAQVETPRGLAPEPPHA
jgi:membrane-bound metal-dependent hydrolase YbcI (DUF457 family)